MPRVVLCCHRPRLCCDAPNGTGGTLSVKLCEKLLDPAQKHTPVINLVEQIGFEFLRHCSGRADSQIHKWNHSELLEIQRNERWTIALTALAGAVSGGILGAVEMGIFSRMMEGIETNDWRQLLPYWSIYLAMAVLISGAEILCLYWIVLRRVARISSIAGLRLSNQEVERVITIGLSRAGLELPNPRAPVYGIDPYARVPRWRQVLYAILYRSKVGLTSFALRIFLRRVLSRAGLRFFVPFISVPIFALWNGLVARWVMREVRIRVAGPVAVQDLGEWISAAQPNLTEKARRLILETVGEAIICSGDAHPNHVLLLTRLFKELEITPESLEIDWQSNRACLKNMDQEAQKLLLRTLTVAVILKGRVRSAQRELLAEAHAASGRPFDPQALSELRRVFIRGQGIREKYLDAVGSRSAQ